MDSSTSTTVLITPRSKSIIFDGNLMKAPPLNRRGRKKWHERYFVLRSNKTLECHKAKKAAEANRSPRRIIDLRECINLEIGLEYKSLQHILSLGTFKRTFFFAAPSDALMLQWANVLEKVKNAQDGESIEVLDIGLRKCREHRAVHRVKPAPSAHRFSIGTPNKVHLYNCGSSKSSITLSHFATLDGSAETINLRDSQESSTELSPGGMRNGNVTPLSGVGNITPNWKGYGTAYFGMGTGSETASEMGDVSSGFGSPVSIDKRSSLVSLTLKSEPAKDQDKKLGASPSIPEQSSSGSSPQGQEDEAAIANLRAGYIPTRVPPPMLATRGKDRAAKGQDQTDSGSPQRLKERPTEFVEKEGSLHRGRAYKTSNSNPKLKRKTTPKGKQPDQLSPTQNLELATAASPSDDSSAILHSNMKRSFRYRKITLKPEKPLFVDQQGGNSSDEEADTESEAGTRPGSKVEIGPGNGSGSRFGTESPNTVIISDEHIKKAGPNFGLNPSPPMTRKFVPTKGGEGGKEDQVARVLCRVRANSYSKVSVGGLKDKEMLADLSSRNMGTVGPKLSEMLAQKVGSESEESRAQGLSLSQDDVFSPESFQLPAHPQYSVLYCSMDSLNSLDNILVDPPSMFDPGSETGAEEGAMRSSDVMASSHDRTSENGQSDERACSPSNTSPLAADRNSTESNDTGYTSGASPSYQERRKLSIPEFEETGSGNGAETESELRNVPTPRQEVQVDIKQSQTSTTSSDSVRCYVPMVFYCPTVSADLRLFAVQVCLVENSDELIKDLVALKGLESYRLVECEDQHGSNVTAFGDDFTVATALEDLEFGFSVVTNTQKDLFMRKVRQFHFEIQDLFGCSKKPFSCDIEIRHSDQMTVLPIEIQRTQPLV